MLCERFLSLDVGDFRSRCNVLPRNNVNIGRGGIMLVILINYNAIKNTSDSQNMINTSYRFIRNTM